VAIDEGGEGGLVAGLGEALQELPIGLAAGLMPLDQPAEAEEGRVMSVFHHDLHFPV
jgi:hypothetical protein